VGVSIVVGVGVSEDVGVGDSVGVGVGRVPTSLTKQASMLYSA